MGLSLLRKDSIFRGKSCVHWDLSTFRIQRKLKFSKWSKWSKRRATTLKRLIETHVVRSITCANRGFRAEMEREGGGAPMTGECGEIEQVSLKLSAWIQYLAGVAVVCFKVFFDEFWLFLWGFRGHQVSPSECIFGLCFKYHLQHAHGTRV